MRTPGMISDILIGFNISHLFTRESTTFEKIDIVGNLANWRPIRMCCRKHYGSNQFATAVISDKDVDKFVWWRPFGSANHFDNVTVLQFIASHGGLSNCCLGCEFTATVATCQCWECCGAVWSRTQKKNKKRMLTHSQESYTENGLIPFSLYER